MILRKYAVVTGYAGSQEWEFNETFENLDDAVRTYKGLLTDQKAIIKFIDFEETTTFKEKEL